MGSNCLQRLSADDTRRQRLKVTKDIIVVVKFTDFHFQFEMVVVRMIVEPADSV